MKSLQVAAASAYSSESERSIRLKETFGAQQHKHRKDASSMVYSLGGSCGFRRGRQHHPIAPHLAECLGCPSRNNLGRTRYGGSQHGDRLMSRLVHAIAEVVGWGTRTSAAGGCSVANATRYARNRGSGRWTPTKQPSWKPRTRTLHDTRALRAYPEPIDYRTPRWPSPTRRWQPR